LDVNGAIAVGSYAGTALPGAAANGIAISGNVGIGTTSPGAKLDIGLAGTTLGTLRLEGNTSGYVQIQPAAAAGSWTMTLPANDGDSGQYLQTNGSGVTSWQTVSSGSLWTDAGAYTYLTSTSDKVSIGTSQEGDTRLRINGGITISYSSAPSNAGSGESRIYHSLSDGTLMVSEDGYGYYELATARDFFKRTGNSFGQAAYIGTNDAYNLYLKTNNTNQVTIDTSGNVGIGMTPTYKLDVTGKVRISDLTQAGGGSNVLSASGVLTTVSSSMRYKENIRDYGNILESIKKLHPVRFNWKDNTLTPGMEDFGLIAEEVYPIIPDLVTYEQDGTTIRGIKYDKLPVLLIQALQEQQTEISNMNLGIGSLGLGFDELGNLVATQSAQLSAVSDLPQVTSTLDTRIIDLENKFAQSEETIASISAQLAQLKEEIALMNVGMSPQASPSSQMSDVSLFETENATVSGTLTVMGKTTVSDLGITGTITIGLLTINGLSSSSGEECVSPLPDEPCPGGSADISTLAGPLRLQALAMGNLEIMGGKVTVDTKGNLKVDGTITAKKVEAEEFKVKGAKTAGQVEIPADQTSVIIEVPTLTEASLIFVTPEEPITVSAKKISPSSAEIRLKEASHNPVRVNWWVIN
jgi:hypothetical protein